jgi:hypothetical protein
MTPTERIAHALTTYPGTIREVVGASGIPKSRLRTWAGLERGAYLPPTASDAECVVDAVRGLLQVALAKLGT